MSIPLQFLADIHKKINWNTIQHYRKSTIRIHGDTLQAFRSTLYFVPKLRLSAKSEKYLSLILFSILHERVTLDTIHFEIRKLHTMELQKIYSQCSKVYLNVLNGRSSPYTDNAFHSTVSFLCLFYSYLHHIKECDIQLESTLKTIVKFLKDTPLDTSDKSIFAICFKRNLNVRETCEGLFQKGFNYNVETNIRYIFQVLHVCNPELFNPTPIFKPIEEFSTVTLMIPIRKLREKLWCRVLTH